MKHLSISPRDAIRTCASVGTALAIALLDYATGPEIELRPLYLVPVLGAALWVGRLPAMATAVVSAVGLFLVNDLVRSDIVLPIVVALAVVRLATFLTVAMLVAKSRESGLALVREAAARDEYVALVAHEVRNPLLGIRAAAAVLAHQPSDAVRAGKTATDIVAEASAALGLLDDLSDVVRFESGRMTSVLRPTDLGALVRATVSTFAAEHHEVRLLGGDSPLSVLGDEQRLAQLLRNLLNNAAKYSPPGSVIEVTVGMSAVGEAAVVAVRDHGAGIPPAERSRLFEKFARLSTAGATRGSGLGLYISQRIAQDHRAMLRADWPAGGGTEFSLTIPLRSA